MQLLMHFELNQLVVTSPVARPLVDTEMFFACQCTPQVEYNSPT